MSAGVGGLRPNRFKPTLVHAFPKEAKESVGPDAKFWKNLQVCSARLLSDFRATKEWLMFLFQFPVSVQESSPIHSVDVCQSKPHLVAVTGATKVQIFDPASSPQEPVKTLTKFKDLCFGGRLRKDGKLLAAGGEDGAVRLFDVATKSQLRCFQGHERATRR